MTATHLSFAIVHPPMDAASRRSQDHPIQMSPNSPDGKSRLSFSPPRMGAVGVRAEPDGRALSPRRQEKIIPLYINILPRQQSVRSNILFSDYKNLSYTPSFLQQGRRAAGKRGGYG
jgi:hypothetical protein